MPAVILLTLVIFVRRSWINYAMHFQIKKTNQTKTPKIGFLGIEKCYSILE